MTYHASLLGKLILLTTLALALSYSSTPAQASSGGSDSSFGSLGIRGSINGPIYGVAVDNQTNIWIVGDFTMVDTTPVQNIAILNPDGSLKSAPSWTGSEFVLHAIAFDGAGSMFAAGKNGVAHFSTTGAYDQFFQNPIAVTPAASHLNTIAVRPGDDKLFVGGEYGMLILDVNGQTNSTQSMPANISGGYISQIRYIAPSAIQNGSGSDFLMVAGAFGAATMTAGGASADVFYNGYPHAATCIDTRPAVDGLSCGDSYEYLVGGLLDAGLAYDYFYPGGNLMWLGRYSHYGLDPAFNYVDSDVSSVNPTNRGFGLSIIEALPDGDMLVGGDISEINGVYVQNFAHVLANGNVDTTFPNNLGFYPTCAVLGPDGKYVIAGYSEYTPLVGFIARRLPIDAPRPVTFPQPPQPQTIYVGDALEIDAQYDVSPVPFGSVWLHNGNELAGQTGSQLYLSPAAASDAGAYRLRVKTFCGATDSSSATITVLPAPPAPANDNFADATVLSGTTASAAGAIRSATMEPGEPDETDAANGASAWWQWTAAKSDYVTIDLSAATFDASLNVFTGTAVSSLSPVANNCLHVCYSNGEGGSNCFCNGLTNKLSFPVTQGQTYYFAFGGTPPVGALGNFSFTVTETAPPIVPLPPWQQISFGTADLLGAAFDGKKYVVVGADGTIGVSTNGSNWVAASAPLADSGDSLYSVTWFKGLFVATADEGQIITSPDGVNWTSRNTGVSNALSLYAVTFNTNVFVAVGDSGTVVTSPDGINWSLQTTGVDTNSSYYSITYGGQFIAAGGNGNVMTSPDGTNWSVVTITSGVHPNAIAYGNSRYVMVGNSPEYYFTNNPAQLYAASVPNNHPLFGLAYGDGYFLAVGGSGEIDISADGNTWTPDSANVTRGLESAAYCKSGRFLIVGDNGTILLHQAFQASQPRLLSNQNIHLDFTGLTGTTVVIQGSSSLSNPIWQDISTNLIINGAAAFEEALTHGTNRYYRARLQ